jgi:hypothetical protein
VFFVAARAGISPERVEAIEGGREILHADGTGQLAARQLAAAIGADPRNGLEQLAAPQVPGRPGLPWGRMLAWVGAVGLVLVLAGLGYLAFDAWQLSQDEVAPPDVVYRTDYVGELLDEEP